jgi:hypothetical protein
MKNSERNKKTNPVALVRDRAIPAERPPLVSEVTLTMGHPLSSKVGINFADKRRTLRPRSFVFLSLCCSSKHKDKFFIQSFLEKGNLIKGPRAHGRQSE